MLEESYPAHLMGNHSPEAALHTRAQEARLTACTSAANDRADAHRKRMADFEKEVAATKAEAAKQAGPLDGVALGRALLQHLGFMN